MIPREKFNAEKRQLFEYASLLCSDAIRMLESAILAAQSTEASLSESVQRQGVHLRELERMIDEMAARIIAIESPVAGDLRLFITYIKVGSDFERISRHAERLSRATQSISPSLMQQYLPKIKIMVITAVAMLRSIAEAMANPNYAGLENIPSQDDVIDALYKEVSISVSNQLKTNVDLMEDGMALLMLLRYMERVGDHATNIAEWIHFAYTGKHINLN